MLKKCPNAERFLARTESLGVVDARHSDAPACVFVLLDGAASEEHRDEICVLARAHWPDRQIVVAPQSAHRVTGKYPKPGFPRSPSAEIDDEDISKTG